MQYKFTKKLGLSLGLILIISLFTFASVAASSTDVFINEIQVSTSSTDWEFFELYGTPGTDLSDLTLIGIESDNYYAAGTIDLVISLAGQSIPSDGFWLGMSPAGETAYGVSGEMSISNNSFENSTATYLLVKNFTGAKDDDVDTDNDGVLDNILWEVIVDAINLRDGDSSDFDYGFVSVGPDGSYLPSGTFRCPDGPAGTFGSNMHNFSAPDGTPGVTNGCGGGPPVEACGDEYTPIYEVQGVGWSSPLDETVVSVEGVVVGDFQLGTQLKGFFVQDAAGDGDPATSDGVFVYDDDTDVSVGDHVRVKGEVDEFFSKTQITKVSSVLLCSSGNVVLPTPIVLPTANLEPFEGMLVMMDQPLYISEYYNYDWVGEMVLSTERQHQPTAMFAPGSPEGLDLADYNYSHRIILDDGSSLSSNPDFTRHPNGLEFTMDNRFRGGDILTGVTGALDYSFGAYKIQPTVGATYTEDNPRLLAPEDVGGEVKVASFNVLNYFTTLDDGVNDICGPLGDMECRGADTQEEFDRQKAKIVEAISIMDADIVGLMEIENNGTAVADLVQGLNDKMGEGTYAYVNTGEIGTDAITVAFIYQPAAVSLEGDFAVLDTPEFVNPMGYATDKNRPALAQTFGVTNGKNGVGVKTFTVVVNHFKSKGSSCGEGDDDPYAGSCNLTRTMAAMELLAWLDTKPTDARKNDFVIIGDLNSYDHEDPINVFLEADYTDLIKEFLGEEAYTYVFDGQLGYLDYALVDKKLANNVTGVTVWHINTDEPDLIDYDLTYKSYPQSLLYAIDPFRSSDHDPVIIGLALDNGKD